MSNKGSMVAAVAIGNIVQVWFQSPTGGDSDSCIFELPCHDAVQAEHIAVCLRADIAIVGDFKKSKMATYADHPLMRQATTYKADYNELSRQDAGERADIEAGLV